MKSTIHIGAPGLFPLGEDLDWRPLDEGLVSAVAGSSRIDVMGGYYSSARLVEMLKSGRRSDRKGCAVRIAVGLDASSKMVQCWRDMREIKEELKSSGFRDVTVKIVTGRPHFHTKLFHFLHKTQHLWLIGSANPGSERHELMVSLRGKHAALSSYMESVFSSATEVTKDVPKRQPIRDVRDFFLSGVLLHNPPRHSPFSFDAFRLQPEDRDKITKAVAAAINVPHANPRTQGFSFSLRSAAGAEPEEEASDEASRIKVRHLSVDTVLGRWVPAPYANEIHQQVAGDEYRRSADLERLGRKISGSGEETVRLAYRRYLAEMERFLNQYGLEIAPVVNRDILFDRFLRSRQKLLVDKQSCDRLARRIVLTSMPDIWARGTSAWEFENSFFDDLAYRIFQGRRERVVRSIVDALGDLDDFPVADEMRAALAKCIARSPWSNDLWQDRSGR